MRLINEIRMVERLDQLIRLKATGTPSELGVRIALSRRQVYRIIDSMKEIGFPIAYCRNKKTFYYTEEVRFKFEVCLIEREELNSTFGGNPPVSFLNLFSSVPSSGTYHR